MNLIAIYKAWREKKKWTKEMQLQNLLRVIQADYRWLGASQVADELTSRYLDLLAPDWYKRNMEDVAAFRTRIGLDPYSTRKVVVLGPAWRDRLHETLSYNFPGKDIVAIISVVEATLAERQEATNAAS